MIIEPRRAMTPTYDSPPAGGVRKSQNSLVGSTLPPPPTNPRQLWLPDKGGSVIAARGKQQTES